MTAEERFYALQHSWCESHRAADEPVDDKLCAADCVFCFADAIRAAEREAEARGLEEAARLARAKSKRLDSYSEHAAADEMEQFGVGLLQAAAERRTGK